jgi:ribosome-binding protein aMBF1 (putative translation factor)
MEESRCAKCGKPEREARLFDAINNQEIIKICGNCELKEDLPLIRRPTTSQLKDSEKPYTVRERLLRIAGLVKEERKEESPTTREFVIREKDKIEAKNLETVDNFHWHIQMARRRKGLQQRQLAEKIGESEAAIVMIERASLPEDPFNLIIKLEQFLGIRLRKIPSEQQFSFRRENTISEEQHSSPKAVNHKIPDFRPETVKNITIDDLRKMRNQERLEKIEKEKETARDIIWNSGKREDKKKETKNEEDDIFRDIEIVDEE